MAKGEIKWRRGDYIKLGRAIANYNKKIRNLEKQGKSLYLPMEYNYIKERDEIKTRKGYNQLINRLARATEENLSTFVILPSGDLISQYEYNEIKREKANYQRQLTRQLKAIDKSLYPYPTVLEMDIERKLNELRSWEYKRGDEFKDVVGGIFYKTSSDMEYKRALNYMNNYKRTMEKYEGFANYDILKEKMDSITNPLEFYKYVGTNELLQDLQYQSDEQYTQERFNDFVTMWGLDLEDDTEIIRIDNEEININNFNEEGEQRRQEYRQKRRNNF